MGFIKTNPLFRNRHFSQLYISIGLIILIVLIGIVGFVVIEKYSVFDALYMTVITVATVGFQEIQPLSDAGRGFTIFLIITSFGTFAYAVTSISKYVIDGEFNQYFKNYKVNSLINKLENHVIICGYGRNGKQAAHVLIKNKIPFIVIEEKKEIISSTNKQEIELIIEGDSTQDEILNRAGISKAKALICTLPNDADNLFIVLTAKTLNPNLIVISRASEDNSYKKLKLAGANNVIMPDKIGGAHMASLVIKPDLIEFMDLINGQGEDTISLDEITCSKTSNCFLNKSISEIKALNKSGVNIIGFKSANGNYVINPDDSTIIYENCKLFILGSTDQITNFKNNLNS